MVHLVVCADIRHTLGASEYAYLSFLTFATHARRRLGMFSAVVVLLPRSSRVLAATNLASTLRRVTEMKSMTISMLRLIRMARSIWKPS